MGKEDKKKQKVTEAWQEKLLQNKDKIIVANSENTITNANSTKSLKNQKSPDITQSTQNSKSPFLIEVDTDGYHIEQVSPINNKDEREARAPYNFIPLNDKIVLSDFDLKQTPFDKYHTDRFTGSIELTIEARTSLYIRDTYTEDQLKEIKRLDDAIDEAKKEKNWNEVDILENEKIDLLWQYNDFYSPGNDEVKLPGSTQRGLIKNIIEIVSYGKFKNFENKRLYFRSYDSSNLQSEYESYGLNLNRSYQMLCGILKKEGSDYFLYETGKPGQISNEDTQTEISSTGVRDFNPKKMKAYPINSKKYYIVVTGYVGRGDKPNHWTVNFKNSSSNKIPVSKKDIKDYKGDENRAEKVIDILKEADSKYGTPCFYTKWKDDEETTRIYFGHTGMFRVPYKKTIAQHVPDELINTKKPDFAEAIFGNETDFAGRVFFEDAVCTKLVSINSAKHPKILSGPKPTTFQHYLTQPDERRDQLKHYNPDNAGKLSELRGYKLYWHKEDNGWYVEEATAQASKKQYTKIKPVDTGTTFKGKIRFENLSNAELGALLFALQLPAGCYHKIGMAKPLGLGSVQITPKLFLSKRDERYINLKSEWENPIKESTETGKKIDDFKNAFATYVLNQLRNDNESYNSNVLWEEEPRMQELKRMLDFEHKPDNDKTRYMEIEHQKYDKNGRPLFKRNGKPETENEFKNRPVLPKPSDVK